MGLFEDQMRLKLLQVMRAEQDAERAAAEAQKLDVVQTEPVVEPFTTVEAGSNVTIVDAEPAKRKRRAKEEPDADTGLA